MIGIDVDHFMDGIPALRAAVQLLIQWSGSSIGFTCSQGFLQGTKVPVDGEGLNGITGAAYHAVGKQAFDQTNRLKKVAMLDRIIDEGKTDFEELMASISNIEMFKAGPCLSHLVRHELAVRIRLGGPLATTTPFSKHNTRSQR